MQFGKKEGEIIMSKRVKFDSIRVVVMCGNHKQLSEHDTTPVFVDIVNRVLQYTEINQIKINKKAQKALHELLDGEIDHINQLLPLMQPVNQFRE